MSRGFWVVMASVLACGPTPESPSSVSDLRVLGASLDPPELMADACGEAPVGPLRYRALVADPGRERELEYELVACLAATDNRCERAAERVVVASGRTRAGELELSLDSSGWVLPDGSLLPQRLAEAAAPFDAHLPLVLRLASGGEEIYAQKRLVLSCRVFEESRPNRQPQLASLEAAGEAWPAEGVRVLRGEGPFRLEAKLPAEGEERYVAPSYKLEPLSLVESWRLSWHASAGSLSAAETGALTEGGGGHVVQWRPAGAAGPTELSLWVVVRDGRGGVSWVSRRARWEP